MGILRTARWNSDSDPFLLHTIWTPYIIFPVVFSLMTFIFINLFVVVLLQNFYDIPEFSVGVINLGHEHIDECRKIWASVDDVATRTCDVHKLTYLITQLSCPLGSKNSDSSQNSWKEASFILKSLDLPVL